MAEEIWEDENWPFELEARRLTSDEVEFLWELMALELIKPRGPYHRAFWFHLMQTVMWEDWRRKNRPDDHPFTDAFVHDPDATEEELGHAHSTLLIGTIAAMDEEHWNEVTSSAIGLLSMVKAMRFAGKKRISSAMVEYLDQVKELLFRREEMLRDVLEEAGEEGLRRMRQHIESSFGKKGRNPIQDL